MGKLPAFLFYPKDWLTDVQLLGCTKDEKGVWIDLLCLMFLAPDRGVLANADGSPWPDEVIAGAIGGDTCVNLGAIRSLLAKGVASRNQCGAIFSRRMIADEKERKQANLRKARSRDRQSGGESLVTNPDVTPDVTVDVTPDVTPLPGNANANANGFEFENLHTNSKSNTKTPCLDEVRRYCRERGNAVNAEQWFDYYEANGWMVGKNPMRDWRAALRTWERNGAGHGENGQSKSLKQQNERLRAREEARRRMGFGSGDGSGGSV
jgi:hypothetical protein